jgi:hypothetical protein
MSGFAAPESGEDFGQRSVTLCGAEAAAMAGLANVFEGGRSCETGEGTLLSSTELPIPCLSANFDHWIGLGFIG